VEGGVAGGNKKIRTVLVLLASVKACADCHCLRTYACEFCAGASGRRFGPHDATISNNRLYIFKKSKKPVQEYQKLGVKLG
jgi:hypothetical protein